MEEGGLGSANTKKKLPQEEAAVKATKSNPIPSIIKDNPNTNGYKNGNITANIININCTRQKRTKDYT